MSPARLALLLALIALAWPAVAGADIAPEDDAVPVEVLQRALCEQEQPLDSCGEGAQGEPLVCGSASCASGPCLLCVRSATSPASDTGPPGIHTARLRADWRYEPEGDPEVVRFTRVAVAGGALGLLALLGYALFVRRASAPLLAGLTLTLALGTALVGLVGRDRAVDDYRLRYEEGTEVVLIPVQAQLPPSWQERAAWQDHVAQLERLLEKKGRSWRK